MPQLLSLLHCQQEFRRGTRQSAAGEGLAVRSIPRLASARASAYRAKPQVWTADGLKAAQGKSEGASCSRNRRIRPKPK